MNRYQQINALPPPLLAHQVPRRWWWEPAGAAAAGWHLDSSARRWQQQWPASGIDRWSLPLSPPHALSPPPRFYIGDLFFGKIDWLIVATRKKSKGGGGYRTLTLDGSMLHRARMHPFFYSCLFTRALILSTNYSEKKNAALISRGGGSTRKFLPYRDYVVYEPRKGLPLSRVYSTVGKKNFLRKFFFKW